MAVVLAVVGGLIVLVGLVDMYRSLLRPSGSGLLARALIRSLWAASRRTGHRLGSAIGPAIMVAVLVMWLLLQALGWALVYLPYLPDGFTYAPGVDPDEYPRLLEALYLSSVILSTLGFGDVVATEPWVRFITPLEGLTGFALLTAALTWFTQIHPPLFRRRSLALELHGLEQADYSSRLGQLDPLAVAQVLDGLTSRLVACRVDLTQHSETYYFQDDPEVSLAYRLQCVLAIRRAAAAAGTSADLRFSAERLGIALDDLATELHREFVPSVARDQVFDAYAADHGRRR